IEIKEESEEIKTAYQLLKEEVNYVKLHRVIAVLANSKQKIEDDLADAMQVICYHTGWPVGHLYLRDEEQDVLNPTKIWYLKDPEKFAPFKKVTEATPLALGEGLPGRVVKSGNAAWIIDVLKDKNFPRARQAIEIGVRAGFAFPILIGTKVVGVMEFFSEEALEPDPKLLEVMEGIGYLLGRIFERYQANIQKEEYDEHLRSLYNRLESARQTEDKRIAGGSQSELI
ncbi:MAG: GAF domain-containing protein, partial [Nitrospinota bacterium]|nr:GAF domain-containing protein [Nitrospinota bacterium]